jgi:hypothetical protein
MNAPDSLATHTLQFGTANILMVPRASTSTANLAAASHSSARVRLICINLRLIKCSQLSVHRGCVGRLVMLRYILTALAAIILLTASLIPEDAFARRGGGGGFRGGGMHAGRVHGGAGRYHGGGRYAGHARPSHPIAGRSGRPVAGRPGRPVAGYPGYGGGYYRRGYGAAAVGAAAAGAYYGGSYGNYGCYYDPYGRYTCPQQYPY